MVFSLYVALTEAVRRALREERGQSMVEYGLIAALIAIAAIAAVTLLGGRITDLFNRIANSL